jgi:HK97 family phage portal protein
VWPFDLWRRDRRRERAVVNFPGGWHTGRPAGWRGGGGHVPLIGHTGDPWGSLSTDWSTVSPHAAENLAAVLAAVNAISTTIAGLPAYVVKADDSRAEVKTHPLERLIRDGCNDSESWSDLIESLLAAALLQGNALARISTDSRGHLSALHTLPWSAVTPSLGLDDQLLFDVLRTQGRDAGKRQRLLRDETIFLKDRSDDGFVGTSRLSRAGGAMKIALSLQASTSTFITNAARPSGVLVAERTIPEPVATRLKADWNEAYRGGELGKVALLSGGVTWTNLGLMSAEDAQLPAIANFRFKTWREFSACRCSCWATAGARPTPAPGSRRASSRCRRLRPGSRSCSAPSSNRCWVRNIGW